MFIHRQIFKGLSIAYVYKLLLFLLNVCKHNSKHDICIEPLYDDDNLLFCFHQNNSDMYLDKSEPHKLINKILKMYYK